MEFETLLETSLFTLDVAKLLLPVVVVVGRTEPAVRRCGSVSLRAWTEHAAKMERTP
ncbi:hypothetical protein D3C80_2135740 [compost metagenome]